jgi:hydrogenase expression/formation protein HypC
MCLAIPGEVVEVGAGRPELAKVEVSGVRRTVNIGLLAEPPAPGTWVLIHVGFALSVVDEAEARATLALLEDLGQAYEDELAAMAGSTIE